MTTMQWIGCAIGALVVLTRLPAVLWPGPYRKVLLDAFARSGTGRVRALGAFLWLLAVTVVVLEMRLLTLLQSVLLVLAVLFAAGGTMALANPDGYRRLTESTLGRMPDWALRCAAAGGVAFGAWLLYLSLTGA